MANNGYKQATIAYKVSPEGLPVDIDGKLTSVSGKRQAIALLEGRANPDPLKYEVEIYFKPRQNIEGAPTVTPDVSDCPVYFIRAYSNRVVLTPDASYGEITIFSSNAWALTGATTNAQITPTTGAEGATVISFKKVGDESIQVATFTNTTSGQTVDITVINVNSIMWILEDGSWNDLGFWLMDGIWNY